MALNQNWQCVFKVETSGSSLRCLPSPDGLIVATCSCNNPYNRSLQLWSTENGACIRTLDLTSSNFTNSFSNRFRWWHDNLRRMSTRDVVFSSDGALLFSVNDVLITTWDVETGKKIRAVPYHKPGVVIVKFSQAGEMLAVGDAQGIIRLLEPDTGRLIRTIQTPCDQTGKVVFSQDCKLLLTHAFSGYHKAASNREVVFVCDVESGKVIREIDIDAQTSGDHSEYILDIAISPDGRFLAARTAHRIALYQVSSGSHQCTIRRGAVENWEYEFFMFPLLSFSRYSDVIASPGWTLFSSMVTLWNVETGDEICTLYHNPVDASGCFSAVFGSSGQVLYSINEAGNSLKAWKPSRMLQENVSIVSNNMHSVDEIAFSPDGKTLASQSSKSSDWIKLWDVNSGQVVYSCSDNLDQLQASIIFFGCPLLFSQDGATVRCGALLWDIEMHNVVGVKAHQLPFDDTCNIRDSHRDSYRYGYATLSSNLQIAAISDRAGDCDWGEWHQVSMWDIPTQRKISTLTPSNSGKIREVYKTKISPNGKIFAKLIWFNLFSTSKSDEAIELWDTHTGQAICSIALPSVNITGDNKYWGDFAFSWDGRVLASNLGDEFKGVIVLSDTTTGDPLCQFSGLVKIKDRYKNAFNRVVSLAFSPNDQILASGDLHGNITLWHLSNSSSGQIRVEEIKIFSSDSAKAIGTLVFSPDGKTLASGTSRSNAAIVLWDVESGMEIQSFPGHLESF